MITIIHGDDADASRLALVTLKDQAKPREIRELDGRNLDATALAQALRSRSLFGTETMVVIENLFGKLGKKTKLIELLASMLRQAPDSTQIILWENKELSPTVVKSLGKVQIKLFKTPQIIFQFLDSIVPNRGKDAVTLYQKLVASEAAEVVFLMLSRRVRQLLMILGGVSPDGLQPWQIGRLTAQAKSFTLPKLRELYAQLLQIDYSIKSGTSPFSLSSHIQQFLLSL